MSSASLTCDGQVIVLRRLQPSQAPLDQHGVTFTPSFHVFLCFDWIIVGRFICYIYSVVIVTRDRGGLRRWCGFMAWS